VSVLRRASLRVAARVAARVAIGAVLAALGVLTGCAAAPTVASVAHEALPESWRGRTAYATPHAVVLARGAGDAREGAELAQELEAEFRDRTGRPATARVLLVMCSGDVTDELPPRVEARLRGRAALDGERTPTARDVERALTELHEAGDAMGIPPDVLLALEPDVIRAADLHAFLGLPPAAGDAFDWCLVLPTRDELGDAVERSTDAALAAQDVSFAVRLLAAPILPFARSAMEDAVMAIARGRLYAAHAAQQADWTRARRRDEVEAYVTEVAGAAEARLRTFPPADGEAPARRP
jgi:hypothetical protein